MKYKKGLKVQLRNGSFGYITKVIVAERRFYVEINNVGPAWYNISNARLGGSFSEHKYDVIKVFNRKLKVNLP